MKKVHVATLLLALLAAHGANAQKVAKIDSLRVKLAVGKDSANQLIGNAFQQTGLVITDATGFYIEADQGQTGNPALGNAIRRVVRANFATLGDTTTILLVGNEIRVNENGQQIKRLRIDNRAGGNGERVWCRMVAAALLIDSTQVPRDAQKPDKCPASMAKQR